MEDDKKIKKNQEKDNLDDDSAESSALDGKGLHDLYRHTAKLIK